jgi:hypothetical protein
LRKDSGVNGTKFAALIAKDESSLCMVRPPRTPLVRLRKSLTDALSSNSASS